MREKEMKGEWDAGRPTGARWPVLAKDGPVCGVTGISVLYYAEATDMPHCSRASCRKLYSRVESETHTRTQNTRISASDSTLST